MKNTTKFINWTKDKALPFWAGAAMDKAGGAYEFLHMDARPINDVLRRVRVQARFAYVYAHASALGWHDNAKPISDHAWSYLMDFGCQGGEAIKKGGFKGCAHLLNPDGSLYDGLRDTYAQAFVIYAGAWRYSAFKDEHALDTAKQTLALLDTHMNAQNGGWLEGLPASLPRRQNPHMHMFEALIALYDATQDKLYLSRASEIFELFKTVFFEEKSGVLLEFFNQDWEPIDDGGPIEPGHMMEWCWLLREYENRSGQDVSLYADTLYETALRFGYNEKIGLLYDCVMLDGKIPNPSLRIWPQLEYLKASIAQSRAGHTGMDKIISSIIGQLFDTYFNVQIDGGWADQLDAEGNIISKNMPTSTFYHLMCAAAEVHKYEQFKKGS